MAKLFPAFNVILNMKPDPTDGEKWLLKKLEKFLPDDYEIYFQASLEGSFPDIVIVRPNHGVVVIEVKDWDLSLYEIDEVEKNWICHPSNQEKCFPRSPFAQVKHYKNLFFGVYSRVLASNKLFNQNLYGIIVPCVFFYNSSSKELNDLFSPHDDYFRKSYTYYLAREDFDNGYFMTVLQNRYIAGDYKSVYFTDEIYNEFKRILRPSYHSLEKTIPIRWGKDQIKYIASKPGKHKIRGVAGCGKTLVMAYRAVDAYRRTRKPVLILTFNITLCNYIHDCISRFRGSIPWSNFVIKHYHRFIADYDNKYYFFQEDGSNGKNNYKDNLPQKFRTILVDETQDYEKEWIDDIHSYLEKDGELVFFGDEEQNIYGRGIAYEGGKIRCYTNVDKSWGTIRSSFRVKGVVANIAEEFQKTYLNNYDDNYIKPAMEDLFAGEGYYAYYYYDGCNYEELCQIFKRTLENKKLSNDDICILSTERNVVRKLDYLLRKRNYKTITNFETEEEYIQVVNRGYRTKKEIDEQLEDIRRTAKYCFWMESGKIKLVTAHSYKGWGINTGIFIIQDNIKLTPELIYTGITRVTRNLIVINIGSQEYDSFFRNVLNALKENGKIQK